MQKGLYLNKVTFPEIEAELRTDVQFGKMCDDITISSRLHAPCVYRCYAEIAMALKERTSSDEI